jgi:nicotinic acid phosphoribosyltransferase
MPPISPLLTDLYELNMIQAYLDRGDEDEAVFEFFVRRLPPRRGFLLAAGLDDALHYLETLQFSAAEIDWLKSTGRFRKNLLDYLSGFRFTGDVHAIPEGSACFAGEPLIRIAAPLPQGQLIETRLINILHFQTLIASKAARMAPKLDSFRRAPATSRALPARPMCWPASVMAYRLLAPWPTHLCKCTATRRRRSRTSRALGQRALSC